MNNFGLTTGLLALLLTQQPGLAQLGQMVPAPAQQAKPSMPMHTAKPLSESEEQDASCLCHDAKREFEAGHYEEAKRLYERYVAKLQETQGPKGYDVARMIQMIGACYRHLDKYKEAVEQYNRSLAILESTRPDDDPEIASTLSGLANVYSDQHLYGDAIKYAERALRVLDTAKASACALSHSLFTLAFALQEAGQDNKAEEVYWRAIKLCRPDPSLRDKELANMLANLSHIYMRREQFEKAEPLLLENLSVAKTLVKTQPDIVQTTALELTSCYDHENKAQAADSLYEHLIPEVAEQAGKDSKAVALLAHDAANHLIDQARFSQAIPYCKEAVRIRTTAVAPGSARDLIIALNNLALCYFRCNRFAEAEPVCKQTLDVLTQQPPENKTELQSAYNNYAKVLRKLGKDKEADELLRKQKESASSSAK
jgi:tetratricopeptide (TPR) repeat protein